MATTAPAGTLAGLADRYAELLAAPLPPPPDEPWLRHSLSDGAAGNALLHIERAHLGAGTWRQAHTWITHAVAEPASIVDSSALFLGMPAVAFMLDAAAAGSTDRYRQGLSDVDGPIARLAHRRADALLARIGAGKPSAFREYDVFTGLAGIGALLLRRQPGSSALERVLTSLVALTHPIRVEHEAAPGWWVGHAPHMCDAASPRGGHLNLGAAHGITGVLALLARAQRNNVSVPGQDAAISDVLDWLDVWRQDGSNGPWWPETITFAEHTRGKPDQKRPARPSWCYGTPGIARAGQQACIALGDTARKKFYETALQLCLSDESQTAELVDAGLCHGWAGVVQTTFRASLDADTPALGVLLPHLITNLHSQAASKAGTGEETGHGLLNGDTGTALALLTAAYGAAPATGWDSCLLIN